MGHCGVWIFLGAFFLFFFDLAGLELDSLQFRLALSGFVVFSEVEP